MSWSGYTAAQQAADQQFVAADELLLVTKSIKASKERDNILESLADYLDATAVDDLDYFSQGIAARSDSANYFEDLTLAVGEWIGTSGAATPFQITLLEKSVGQLADSRAELLSVANRSIPWGIHVFIMFSSVIVACFMGASLSNEPRPRPFGWALMISLAMSVYLSLAHPFNEPFGIKLDSLVELSELVRYESSDASANS